MFLNFKTRDFFPDHFMHRAEGIPNVLILWGCIVINVILGVSTYASCTEANHTGFLILGISLHLKQKLVMSSLGWRSQ